MKNALFTVSVLIALASSAAPAKQDPVAEGFRDFENVNDKHFVTGRLITPSSLRHRVVVVTEIDAEKMRANMGQIGPITVDKMPPSHIGSTWDTLDRLPRECVWVVSIRNGKADQAAWREATKSPKTQDDPMTSVLTAWGGATAAPAVYNEVLLKGYEHPENYPYVYVLDGKSEKPVFEMGNFTKANLGKMNAAVNKAVAALGQDWKPLTGVAEVQHFPNALKIVKGGKSVLPALKILVAGIKDKNPEKAAEAQTFYDALWQERDDLMCRVTREYRGAPARAFVDAQRLCRLFPSEKKKLTVIDSFLKQNKDAATLGKIFEKYVEWSAPDFMFKNAGEAKKAVAMLNASKKQLEKMSQNQDNAQISGEAALVLSQIDLAAEALMMKVPQK